MDAEDFKAALLHDGFSADIRELPPGPAPPGA